MEKKRIEWVDIYKALGIILVVVGHATGAFNTRCISRFYF